MCQEKPGLCSKVILQKVNALLHNIGLGTVYDSGGPGNSRGFMIDVRKRLFNFANLTMFYQICITRKCITYRDFVSINNITNRPIYYRAGVGENNSKLISRFLCRNHYLFIETGSWGKKG